MNKVNNKPTRSTTVRKIKEILRAHQQGLPKTKIASNLNVARGTVINYIKKFENLNLNFDSIVDKSDSEIYNLLFKIRKNKYDAKTRPDMKYIDEELKKKNVTLELLWEEFIDNVPDGIGYPRLAQLYSVYKKKKNLSLRQNYKYGEKCFLDLAGHTIPILNLNTKQISHAQIFVAVLAASNYTFAYALESQNSENWINANIKALEFFNGVPQELIPDNLRAAVSKASLYEPDINPSYQNFAIHYNTIINPTRPRKPKDKAKVEKAVQLVERWILASLRNRTFNSIFDLNQSISQLLEKLNNKILKIQKNSRKELFLKYEQPTLKPLPKNKYEFAKWKKFTIPKDYHVKLENHYYSVPYSYVNEIVEILYNDKILNVLFNGKPIAKHIRKHHQGNTTIPEHMPNHHKEYSSLNRQTLIRWADNTGKQVSQLFNILLDPSSPRFIANLSSAKGIKSLARKYPADRINNTAKKILDIGISSKPCQSMKSILNKNLDLLNLEEEFSCASIGTHQNIRGPSHYSTNFNMKNKEETNVVR